MERQTKQSRVLTRAVKREAAAKLLLAYARLLVAAFTAEKRFGVAYFPHT
jgi:hypothetical protein